MEVMYAKNLNHYVYVCPCCFNTPAECTCAILPLALIQVDKQIWPTIKELNRKGYLTESCCEGHVGYNEMIYVLFKKKHKINSTLPKGFEGDATGLRAIITGSSDNGKKRKKRQLLNALYEWACLLESQY